MFGIDIVVEKGTGHHVVIDINYFPGKFNTQMPTYKKNLGEFYFESGSFQPQKWSKIGQNECENTRFGHPYGRPGDSVCILDNLGELA